LRTPQVYLKGCRARIGIIIVIICNIDFSYFLWRNLEIIGESIWKNYSVSRTKLCLGFGIGFGIPEDVNLLAWSRAGPKKYIAGLLWF
jgi:hypothetical protein